MARALTVAYFVVGALLCVHGIHRFRLLWFHLRRRIGPPPPVLVGEPPRVLVQLPMFNERCVAARAIAAAAALAWPRDRLAVQVLDDSIDGTQEIVRAEVERWRATGLDIVCLHRDVRQGFKAGALAAGLTRSNAELVAIFDADFVPDPGFLQRTVPFFAEPRVGMVQVRWDHLNRNASFLTRAQASLLDGHFVLESGARSEAGLFFNFNGTAGVWRRAAIEQAGGWQGDTLTEDLDLSYRSQLAGWRFVFVADPPVPAELPETIAGFKSQQHRWAMGSIQTARKLVPRILASSFPWRIKLEAGLHLTNNLGFVLVLLLCLLRPLAAPTGGALRWVGSFDLLFFVLLTLSSLLFYGVAMREAGASRQQCMTALPAQIAIGIGAAVNGSAAVFDALRGVERAFERTPKQGTDGPGSRPAAPIYRSPIDRTAWLEVALGLWYSAEFARAALAGAWRSLPFMTLFAAGFLYLGGGSLFAAWSARRTAQRSTLPLVSPGLTAPEAAAVGAAQRPVPPSNSTGWSSISS